MTVKTTVISLILYLVPLIPDNGIGQEINHLFLKDEKLDFALFSLANLSGRNIIFPDSLVTGKTISGTYYKSHLVEILYDISRKHSISFLFDADSSITVIRSKYRKSGTFNGTVSDKLTGEPISDCLFYSDDSKFFAQTNDSGKISFKSVPSGIYKIVISRLGYRSQKAFVCFNPQQNLTHKFQLNPSDLSTEEIIVLNPIDQLSTEKLRYTEIPEITTTYNYYQDVFRSLQSITGVTGNEISANFSIRGGHPDENKIILNNLELLTPYHFDNFFNLTSIVNQDLLENHNLYRDGFSAKYGNRMSGVFEMSTKTNHPGWKVTTDQTGTSAVAGASLKGYSGLISYRTGNLGTLYRDAYDSKNLVPFYSDFFGTFNFKPTENQKIEVNILTGYDKFKAKRNSKIWTPNINSEKTSGAFWLNHDWMFNNHTLIKTTVSRQSTNRLAEFDFFNSISKNNPDNFRMDLTGFEEEVTFEPKSGHLAQAGFGIHAGTLSYKFNEIRYRNSPKLIDTIAVNLKRNPVQFGLWSQYSLKLSTRHLLTGGLRADFRTGSPQILLDPRLSFLWTVIEPVLIKVSIGHYSQFQPFERVDIGSGNPTFQKPEKSVQLHTSGTLYFDKNFTVETAFYYKNYYQLFDDQTYNFEDRSLLFNPINDDFNPTHGISKGFDLMARQTETYHYWMVGYGIGKSTLEGSNISVPRMFYNPWKLELAFGLKLENHFTFDLLWKNQSGFPYTEQKTPTLIDDIAVSAFFVEYGRRNGLLSAGNQFLKLKLGKSYELKWVRVLIFGGIYNLFNLNENFQYHQVSKNNKIFEIPINKKIEIPRVLFAGFSIEGL